MPSQRLLRLFSELRSLRQAVPRPIFLRYLRGLVLAAKDLARTRSLACVDQRFDKESVAFRVLGTTVLTGPGGFSGGREMYARQVYFLRQECLPPPCGWILDLGANQGLFSILAAKRGAKVIAVEGQPGFRHAIEAGCKRNGLGSDDVHIVSALVGASTGILSSDEGWTSASHTHGQSATHTTLEAIIEQFGVERFSFVKIDIEGSEYALITPGAPWLGRVDRIAMEVHGAFGDPDDLASILTGEGFQVALADPELRPRSRLHHKDGYLYAWRPSASTP